ncbi:hypothetical protein H7271_06205 [Bittarella massiliensis]|uniref:hypothetical protein n=1 Tax=Bittarella massiliensis (ex Durand et al. 2017) TaxID=1720313 RepID=UPI00163BA524|nr:hypothetical protein [Bittarella massiliensis (ex Durand et al. 2017)]MBC2871196.1 hypothetical protein [Bittarella massiliensis (ex Durand et al. 2017)]
MKRFLKNALVLLVAATLLTGCGRTKLMEAQADEGLGLGKDEFIALYNKLIVKELAGNAEKIGEQTSPTITEHSSYIDIYGISHPYREVTSRFKLENELLISIEERENAKTITNFHLYGPATVGMPYIRAFLNCLKLSKEDREQVEQSIQSLVDKGGSYTEIRGGFYFYLSISGKLKGNSPRTLDFDLSIAPEEYSGRDIDQ